MTSNEFALVAHEMHTSLRPFALKLTKDHEEANDLLQETMLKAFAHCEKFAEGTNLKAWMYTIMKNTFITNYQRMVRKKTFIDTTDNLHFINSTSHTIQNDAYPNFTMNDIKGALDGLQATYKVPFLMHFSGYKYHEIAEHLNIPIGTVKNRIHIARKMLMDRLDVYGSHN